MSIDVSFPDPPANGIFLRFYTHVHARHDGLLISEWLLELADDLPLKVEFLLSAANAQTLLRLVRQAGIDVVYAWSPVHFGVLGKEGNP